jgi:hypothetical protein
LHSLRPQRSLDYLENMANLDYIVLFLLDFLTFDYEINDLSLGPGQGKSYA